MEHESFEDASIAELLNRDFVSIKVDREERPDVDRVYMAFVQATTGAGGWPMSVWLTPDLKPFFGGTYFPPESRWGRPGFADILGQLARAWKNERGQVVQSADTVLGRLRDFTGGDGAGPDRAPIADRDAIDLGVQAFVQSFDRRHGGFGGAPKFPRPAELLFLLNAHAFTGDQSAKQMALDTLRAMALGGMRDHVGGGFHRYSVDAEWRVPHFEKMLYDQAQLVLAYLDAAQASGEDLYATVAEDTLDYVRRDLTSPEGGFFSAEDADSLAPGADEKKEGAFYVWSAAEIDRLLGDDAPVVRRRFGIEDNGNALADPQGEFTGQNLLYVAQAIDEIAARIGRSADDVMATLVRARDVLARARAGRPRPHLDDKVITAWNGLMIAAMARAARVLVASPDRGTWRDAAVAAAEFVQARLWQPDRRRLLRRYRDGEAAIDAFCEDYACLVWGLIELFQATGDGRWLTWAADLTTIQGELFFDENDGGWFSTTGDDPSVLLRMKEDYDGAEPAAASVTVRNLTVLGQLLAERTFTDRAARTLERYGPQIGQVVRVMPLMVSNVAHWRADRSEIVIVGPRGRAETVALERVLAERYLPFAVVVPVDPEQSRDLDGLPWISAMAMREGRATAYVCQSFACQQPVTEPEALARQLELASSTRRIII